MIKEDWKTAKEMVVDAIINIETDIKRSELLYGENKETDILKSKKAVLYFICWSLPNINKEGEFQLNAPFFCYICTKFSRNLKNEGICYI